MINRVSGRINRKLYCVADGPETGNGQLVRNGRHRRCLEIGSRHARCR